MDMKKLFEDFSRYVENMSKEDVVKSIAEAVEHTANSYILDEISEKGVRMESSVQKTLSGYSSRRSFMFCSSVATYSDELFKLSESGGMAA